MAGRLGERTEFPLAGFLGKLQSGRVTGALAIGAGVLDEVRFHPVIRLEHEVGCGRRRIGYETFRYGAGEECGDFRAGHAITPAHHGIRASPEHIAEHGDNSDTSDERSEYPA